MINARRLKTRHNRGAKMIAYDVGEVSIGAEHG
jgi:hypothetical protein